MNIVDKHFDFSHFTQSGLIMQKPESDILFLGVGIQEKESGEYTQHTFFGDSATSYSAAQIFQTTVDQFIARCQQELGDRLELAGLQDYDDQFTSDVVKSLKWIAEKKIDKIVNVTKKSYQALNLGHPLSGIAKLSKLNGSLYGHWINGEGVIGVSPEPLYIYNGESWSTRALAGTIQTGQENYETTLLEDQKELFEHRLVIDDIKEKLEPHAKRIDLDQTTVLNYGQIAHLKTDIRFELVKESNEKHLVSSLAPTAALGGYPYKESLRLMKRLKYYQYDKDERTFGGIVSFRNGEHSWAVVAIRNLNWDQAGYYIHSGCGIVGNSIPEKELREIRSKRKTIESVYGI